MISIKHFSGNFLVWRKTTKDLNRKPFGPARFRHQTLELAITEAKRLLDLFPESTFVVTQEVARIKNKDETDVGDPENLGS